MNKLIEAKVCVMACLAIACGGSDGAPAIDTDPSATLAGASALPTVSLSGSRDWRALDGSALDADGAQNGTISIAANLVLARGATIDCAGDRCDVTLVVQGDLELSPESALSTASHTGGKGGGALSVRVGGALILRGGEPGADISSSDGASGTAGDIHIVATTVLLERGSRIHADSRVRSAGHIDITATKTIDVGGLVRSESGLSGTGARQAPGGGPISLIGSEAITVDEGGCVASIGKDPGADLVHLEGGNVTIRGSVESTGAGHGVPNEPTNGCSGASHPDKPSQSTACVEVWAGDKLVVDGAGTVNADVGFSGGVAGHGWIDLVAKGDVSVTGSSADGFAVHANMGLGNGHGGTVHVVSETASVTATGRALMANDTGSGGAGGHIAIDAANDVVLDDAQLVASGDNVGTGGLGAGGAIAVTALHGGVLWRDTARAPAVVGDVRPTADAKQRGTIQLTTCSGGALAIADALLPAVSVSTHAQCEMLMPRRVEPPR